MVTGSKWIKNQILIATMMDIYLSLFMVCVIRDGTWEKKQNKELIAHSVKQLHDWTFKSFHTKSP